MKLFITFLTLMILTAGSPAVGADDHDARAEAILESLGRRVGLVHLPRCGDGALGLALLAADETLRVHGQDTDYAQVQAARRQADEQGVAGRRAWFDHGDVSRLLPVGNSSDLIVMSGLTAADLSPALAGEITRVLHSWYGVALLAGEVPPAAMARWAAEFDGLGLTATLVSRQEEAALATAFPGVLLRVEKPALPGADNWSHFWHGPDNNPVSTDTAYSYPETIQWTGTPLRVSKSDLPIVANGRLFMLWNAHVAGCYSSPGDPVLPGEEVELRTHGWATAGLDARVSKDAGSNLMNVRGPLLEVRATGSGVQLWTRRMSPMMWMQHQRSVVVADGDRLLVADGNTLRVLDQATGEERRSRVIEDYEEIKWMAVADGTIAVLSGPTIDRFPERMRRNPQNDRRILGRLLTVLDGESLETRWEIRRADGTDEFDPRSAAIDNGRLFITTAGDNKEYVSKGAIKKQKLDTSQLFTTGIRAEAYRLSDGALQWEQETDIKRRRTVLGFAGDTILRHPVAGWAMGGIYIISAVEDDLVVMLLQEDGQQVRSEPQRRSHGVYNYLYYKDLLFGGSKSGSGVDPVSGEVEMKYSGGVGGCGHLTAAPQGIVGQDGLTWNAVTGQRVGSPLYKSQCAASSFVANGLNWRLPVVKNKGPWPGHIVRGAVEQDLPAPGPRLVRSVDPSPGVTDAQAVGWTSHRGDATRSSSAAVTVADTVTLRWSVPSRHPTQLGGIALIGPRIAPVPPVTAGKLVITADNEGAVQALDLETGDQRWRTHTGGRIESSPTIWKDRVFVGSTDGHVYAFALADGRELWRLRVAPEAGRMTLYDQLGSRWPVFGSPLIADGKMVAVAGNLEAIDGLHAVAADAVTGELQWEHGAWRDPEGEAFSQGRISGASGVGQLCWDAGQGEAVFNPEGGMPVRFSVESGSPRAAFARGRLADILSSNNRIGFGRAVGRSSGPIGKIAPDWIVRGGVLLHQEKDGRGRMPLLGTGGGMPSWDDTDVLLTFETGRHSPKVVVMVPKARLLEFMSAQLPDKGKGGFHKGVNVLEQVEELGGWSTKVGGRHTNPHTRALTRNAALVLTSHQRGAPKLTAYKRVDGTVLWEQELPTNAIGNGLAVAADGSIIVALEDGQIIRIGAAE